MEDKLNFQDLVDLLAQKAEMTKKDAELFLNEFFELITESLSDTNPVKVKDFGTFKLTSIQARESVDVNTGEKIEIPAHNRVTFSPATALKELVNKPFSHFESTLINEGFDPEGITFEPEENEDNEPDDDVEVGEITQANKNVNTFDIEVKVNPQTKKMHVTSTEPEETFLTSVIYQIKNNSKPILTVVLGGLFLAGLTSILYNTKKKKRKTC